jgi:hypothetical protein
MVEEVWYHGTGVGVGRSDSKTAVELIMIGSGMIRLEGATGSVDSARRSALRYRACCRQYTSFMESSSPFRLSWVCVKTRWLS